MPKPKSNKSKTIPMCDGSFDCGTKQIYCDKCIRNPFIDQKTGNKDYYTEPSEE